MKKRKNIVKYRFSCKGPLNLTEFNVEWNKQIEAQCKQKDKFNPHPSCQGCSYLEIKRLG